MFVYLNMNGAIKLFSVSKHVFSSFFVLLDNNISLYFF